MKIYSMSNQKGGVAKTSSVLNLSAALVKLGKKVLVIDMDPQGNCTSGLNRKNQFKKSIYDVLVFDFDIVKAIIHTDYDGLDLIPSSISLANSELELASVFGRESLLRDALLSKKLEEIYDYIIIDTNPSLGILPINSLVAADEVIIPMEPDLFSFEGIDQLIKVITLIKKKLNKKLEIAGVLLTKVDSRTNIAKEFENEIRNIFHGKVFKSKINNNVKVVEAHSERMPVVYYDENAKASLQYLSLAKELVDIES